MILVLISSCIFMTQSKKKNLKKKSLRTIVSIPASFSSFPLYPAKVYFILSVFLFVTQMIMIQRPDTYVLFYTCFSLNNVSWKSSHII
jgi:hypothetical protein